MARIIRLTINWTGFTGAPGYTNLHFESPTDAPISQEMVNDAVAVTETWMASWRPDTPNGCLTGVSTNIPELDENTGTIEAFWTAGTAAPASGASNGEYAGGSGACVNWYTDGVWNGRRVRGRTFLVPLGSNGMSNNGSLSDTRLAVWRTATATLIGAANLARLVVWRRPVDILGEPFVNGGAYDVNSYTINDKAAQLRSRRD